MIRCCEVLMDWLLDVGPSYCGKPVTHVVSFDTSSDEDTFLTCTDHSTINVPARVQVYALPVE